MFVLKYKKSFILIAVIGVIGMIILGAGLIFAAKNTSKTVTTADYTIYQFPEPFVYNGVDAGTRLVDIDSDGYVDLIRSFFGQGQKINRVYFNDQKGGWILNLDYVVPVCPDSHLK